MEFEEISIQKEFDDFCYDFAEKYKEYFEQFYDSNHIFSAGTDLSIIFMCIRNGMPVKQSMFEYKVTK